MGFHFSEVSFEQKQRQQHQAAKHNFLLANMLELPAASISLSFILD